MGETLNPPGTFKVYKRSRFAYLFYYFIILGFFAFAIFTRIHFYLNIAFFILFIIFLVYFELHIARDRLIVDDKKVLMKRGLLSVESKSVLLRSISDIRVNQNFIQSILGYGTLELNIGGGEYELKMEKLKSPVKVREDIEERLHKLY